MTGKSLALRMLKMQAGYNKWAWGVFLRVVHTISTAHYHQHAGLFAGSIHGTVNHILLADFLWFQRLTGQGPPFHTQFDANHLGPLWSASEPSLAWSNPSHTVPVLPPLSNLAQVVPLVDVQCQRWIDYVAQLDDAQADASVTYRSTSGDHMNKHRAAALVHVFNHATHHRGQASAALTRLGYPSPEMDVSYYLDTVPSL
jgi:uncharacterized damage-inducible protein DinB